MGKYVYVQGYIVSYKDSEGKQQEIKVAKEIRDLSKNNRMSEEHRKLLEDLEDYNWLEDSEEMEI